MAATRIAALLAIVLVGLVPGAVAAADHVTFGRPTATSAFETGVAFRQPVTVTDAIERVELLLTSADAIGPQVLELPAPSGSGPTMLEATLDPAVDGHLLPNTPMSARWRVTTADGRSVVGPSVAVTYRDDRFDWRTVEGDIVRVHWYEGGTAFGERALRIGEEAVRETAELLGVRETEPVDFFIYADQQAFYDALGPGTRENVGGQANAGIRTLFALIGPGSIDDPWVSIVIPHELVHLVFDTAADNPYHFPPRWLNEGLATYLSEGYSAASRRDVERAARAGELIPLEGLGGQFPTTADRFFLAYAESVSAVDFLIRTHGEDALVALIRSYADGRTDDEAFEAAVGSDLAAFDAAWLADLGAERPVRHGPQPAPAGPVPDDWSASPGASAPTGPTADPSAPPPTAGPVTPVGGGGDGPAGVVLAVGVALLLVAAVAIVVAWRRRSAGAHPARGWR